jgi:hypothetical protein
VMPVKTAAHLPRVEALFGINNEKVLQQVLDSRRHSIQRLCGGFHKRRVAHPTLDSAQVLALKLRAQREGQLAAEEAEEEDACAPRVGLGGSGCSWRWRPGSPHMLLWSKARGHANLRERASFARLMSLSRREGQQGAQTRSGNATTHNKTGGVWGVGGIRGG